MYYEIAGVPFEVRCQYKEEIRRFLKDYVTGREPVFTIEPTEEDRIRMQMEFDRMAEAEGSSKVRYSEAFLENNAIHALLAERMVGHGVLLMHGSALCMDGQGYIFTAPSGTGKSTHARLWREAFGDRVWMINDDKPMLKVDEMKVYGTPWNGKHRLSRNSSAPLKAIVSLERSAENRISAMEKADAFPALMKQAYVSRNPATMAKILAMEKQLVEEIDFYKMGCTMDPEAAQTAWMGMNSGLSDHQTNY